jgi:hypothetical protein
MMTDKATRGWQRCQHGAYMKYINGYLFRLWRGPKPGMWEVSLENMFRPCAPNINEAKRLAHRMAARMPRPSEVMG